MSQKRMPVLFVGHGSPMNAIGENRARDGWRKLCKALPKPSVILALSAHWMSRGKIYVRRSGVNPQVYDMYGFPKELYQVHYEPAGSSSYADKVLHLLGDLAEKNDSWGIDHGIWTVLSTLYPEADIPVVMVSTDLQMRPEGFYDLGRRLSPLREDGAMLFASGNIVHNLRSLDWENAGGYPWADHFDKTIKEAVLSGDHKQAIHYENIQDSNKAVLTPEHFLPFLAALGAARREDRITVCNDYRELGSMSMTSYLFESN